MAFGFSKKSVSQWLPGKKGMFFGSTQNRLSAGLITWFLFAVIVILELFLTYKYIYLNLVFDPPRQEPSATVRINFENYEKVIKRLDEVARYSATSTIEFLVPDRGSGRDNPFADP